MKTGSTTILNRTTPQIPRMSEFDKNEITIKGELLEKFPLSNPFKTFEGNLKGKVYYF